MKELYLKLIVAASLLDLCCHPAPTEMPLEKPGFYWGYFQAHKNGIIWQADPYAKNNSIGDSLFLVNSHFLGKYYNILESFSILIPLRIGRYKIHSFFGPGKERRSESAFFYKDDDLTYASYDVIVQDSSNFVELLSYDSTSGEVKGRFHLAFKLVQKAAGLSFPDTLVFSKGVFHTRIVK